MSGKDNRWSQLMSNLEAVVYCAEDLVDYGEMTLEQYEEINNTIAELENKVRMMR